MKVVIYKRVSTDKQGIKGLGMEAQEAAIQNYLSKNPSTSVLSSFAEVETGTNKRKRPELKKALELCKAHKATLVVATLSRLSRNVHFISGLVESKVDFLALDLPSCDKTMLYFMAVASEWEADAISKRTKVALQALKAQGKKLGTPRNLTEEAKAKGLAVMNQTKTAKARAFANQLAPTILQLKLQQYSIPKIVEYLNANKVPTASGRLGVWQTNKVTNCLKQLEVV